MYYLLLQLFSTTTTNTSLLDVDQMFSCFADKLAVMDVHVLEDLHNIIRGSYTPIGSAAPAEGCLLVVMDDRLDSQAS